jgi:hypothetical protein
LGQDPIRQAGKNLFAYAENDVLNMVDPDGRDSIAIGAIWGGVIGGPAGVAVGGATGAVIDAGIALGVGVTIGWLLDQYFSKPKDRGLPPKGVLPPVKDPSGLVERPASRPSEGPKGGKSLWDQDGGEWRYVPEDKWRNPHWDYNPHDVPNSEWQNRPIGDKPTHKICPK